MLIVLAAKAPIKILDFAWYKFMGARNAQFNDHHRKFDLELENGEVFGLKPSTKGKFDLVDAGDLTTVFKLSLTEIKNLLKRSSSFKGKVNKVSTKNSIRGLPAGNDTHNTLDRSKGTENLTIEVDVASLAHPKENKKLTSKLKKVKHPGMSKLEFIQAREMLPGEVYYYYDAISTLRSYRRLNGLGTGKYGTWARDLERAVEKQIKGIDVEIGSVPMKGTLRHLLVVVDT